MFVRRGTLVLIAVAVLVIALVWGISRSSQPTAASLTPTVTPYPKLFVSVVGTDIVEAIYRPSDDLEIDLARNSDLTWTRNKTEIVSAGKVEQLLSELFATRVLIGLPPDYSLESLGLNPAQKSIVLKTEKGDQIEVKVGIQTPTETGYYVQVSDSGPVVVSKYAIDAVIELFNQALADTPTPTESAGAEPSVTPAP